MKDLAVDRNGWVRIAIPASRTATDVGFQCYPTKAAPGRAASRSAAALLTLNDAYAPSPRPGAGTMELKTGEMRALDSQGPQ